MNDDLGMEQRSLVYSALLHAGLLLIVAFGIPTLFPHHEEPTPLVMTVDILPIAAITNVKPSDQPIEKKQEAPTPPTPKPMPAPVVAPPKPAETKPAPPEGFNPNEETPPKTEEASKPEEQKPQDKEFAAVLKNLAKESPNKPEKDAKDKTTTPENTTRSNAAYDASLPLSMNEKDAIRNQFIKCWRMPAGAKDPHSLAVRVHVKLKEDGSLISVEISSDQTGRYSSDSFFRAAADSAIRAVHECTEPPMGPLKNLPPDKYGAWQDMELNFDPSELLG